MTENFPVIVRNELRTLHNANDGERWTSEGEH